MIPDIEDFPLPLVAPVGFITLAPLPVAAMVTSQNIRQFPLTPGAVWDEIVNVVWNVLPRSKFAEAARAMDLQRERQQDGTWDVTTSQEELAMLILWAWDHK